MKKVAITLIVCLVVMSNATATNYAKKITNNNNNTSGVIKFFGDSLEKESIGMNLVREDIDDHRNYENTSGVIKSIGGNLDDYNEMIKEDVNDYINNCISEYSILYNDSFIISNIDVSSGVFNDLGRQLDTSLIADTESKDIPISTTSENEEKDTEIVDPEYSVQEDGEVPHPFKEAKTKYVKCDKLNGRTTPSMKEEYDNITTTYKWNDKITIYGRIDYTEWVYTFDEKTGYMIYIDGNFLSSKKQKKPVIKKKKTTANNKPSAPTNTWRGERLNRRNGKVSGPSGPETYYNLNMSGVIRIMRREGFSETQYPYWVRADGAKMLGSYVMVAANLAVHPRGSIINTTLGKAIVCDTGGFVKYRAGIDVAVSW